MENLGIDLKLLIAQIVNFAIIVVVLSKFLYKPILAMLAKRKKEIDEGLALTEKMRIEEERQQEKRQKMLAITRREAQEILEEARKQAKVEEKEIVESAHKEAEAVVAKGKTEVERARVEMEKNIQKSAVTLAVAMTERLLEKVLSAEEKHKLIAKNVKDIENLKTH